MFSKQLPLTTFTLVMQQATSASIDTNDHIEYNLDGQVHPQYCPEGYEVTGINDVIWCIKFCEEGYTEVGGFCYQNCPTDRGFTDMGIACGKPPLKSRNPQFKYWWNPVPSGHSVCGAFWAYTCPGTCE